MNEQLVLRTITTGRRSFHYFKFEMVAYIASKFSKKINILDVGPGDGIYAKLLKAADIDCNIVGVEVYEPTFKELSTNELYSSVLHKDIVALPSEFYADFDLYILGDVLEHLSVADGQKLITTLYNSGGMILAQVPYLYKQYVKDGNVNEIHLQPDLTPSVMEDRYPELQVLFTNNKSGVYTNKINNKEQS